MTQHYWLEKGAAEGHHQEAKKKESEKAGMYFSINRAFLVKK